MPAFQRVNSFGIEGLKMVNQFLNGHMNICVCVDGWAAGVGVEPTYHKLTVCPISIIVPSKSKKGLIALWYLLENLLTYSCLCMWMDGCPFFLAFYGMSRHEH